MEDHIRTLVSATFPKTLCVTDSQVCFQRLDSQIIYAPSTSADTISEKMPPTRLIIELNHCFEPNAFNSGPPICTAGPPLASKIEAPSPRLATFYSEDPSPPALSASPGSSIASSTPPLTLDDEEIRRIFSYPKYNYPSSQDQSCQQMVYHSPFQRLHSCSPYLQANEDLNPNAEPFIPAFAHHILGSPNLSQRLVSLTNAHPPPPLYPPGLPHPPVNASTLFTPNMAITEAPPEYCFPAYLPVLLDALQSRTTPQEREVLMNFIVTSVEIWNAEDLLELAEQISVEACNSGLDFNTDGEEFAVCPPARYLPFDPEVLGGPLVSTPAEKNSESVALAAEELYRQFSKVHGQNIAQGFAWNLREVVLMKFINYWDGSKPGSISYQPRPSPRYVRSALALSRCIACLYERDLISQSHISMCISLLLADLKSVEHTEALSAIVLGCGQSFWAPTKNFQQCQYQGRGNDDLVLLAKDGHWMPMRLSQHVHDFLLGLEANFVSRGLRDDRSVVGQTWGEGQLIAKFGEISNSVRGWEALLLSQL